jgi:predicted nucleic acid-binding protein
MAQIIDASVAIAWCVPTQATELSEGALAAVTERGGHVPAQFWFEVVHGLDRAERRDLIARTAIEEFLLDLVDLPLTIHAAYTAEAMLNLRKLAHQHRLNIYDASYLELSIRLRHPLATQDGSLARAAKLAGASLFVS